MPTTDKALRVLIVDDNRDGADALGLLVEELGNKVHVTYGGTQALDVATAFRPDLMLVDLLMPGMDGCALVMRFRQIPAFAQTKIVAITGQKDEEHKTSALEVGFDAVLVKPTALTEIKAVLASVVVSNAGQSPKRAKDRAPLGAERRLSIDEARRIRNERESKTLTQAESEAAICDGIICFQQEYLGWRSEQVRHHGNQFSYEFFLAHKLLEKSWNRHRSKFCWNPHGFANCRIEHAKFVLLAWGSNRRRWKSAHGAYHQVPPRVNECLTAFARDPLPKKPDSPMSWPSMATKADLLCFPPILLRRSACILTAFSYTFRANRALPNRSSRW